MTANSFDLLDADQPIPLGRSAGPIAASPEVQPAVELPAVAPLPDVHAQQALATEPVAVVAEPEAVPAMASTTPDAATSPASPPVPSRWPATHPMDGLRGFRLEPIPVERPDGGRRDLVRFLVSFALVMAFVYALILAFVLLLAHTRGTV